MSGNGGTNPEAGLIFDRSGDLYGATPSNGQGGAGAVFEMSPLGGTWMFNVLSDFSGGLACGPRAALVMDANGALYGTTYCGGAYRYGNVFKLTSSSGGWIYSDLYDFTGGNDGGHPSSNVTFDSFGNLYGTASCGGDSFCTGQFEGNGVVWKITP